MLSLINFELASFSIFKKRLFLPITLVYYSLDCVLWINLDASKKFEFGVIFFYTTNGHKLDNKWLLCPVIQPIIFLFHLFTAAKQNYWLTELKIAGFVWTVKKIYYLIESFKQKIIIQTDYLIIINIVKQCSIIFTTSIIHMNLQLVRALQFLC